MNCIANLAFLDEKTNIAKKGESIFDYIKKKINKDSSQKKELNRKKKVIIDKYFFIKKEDLDFLEDEEFTNDDYNTFLEKRWNKLKELFFTHHNIE